MSRIKVLPDLLVNKIAAGEVIERPASVVKELVENSVDAGAQRITVTIEDGGKQLIRVSDDGVGMGAEDLRLAVTPHATSKLTHEEDLFRIGTLGFRGEALPSIGAVSRLTIRSRPVDCLEGNQITVAAETIESSTAAGCRPGTTVEVRDLFFNVPARRKFLRSKATEVGHINEQFMRIALAHRDVGFDLINNQRTTQRLNEGSNLRDRIAALFGSELAEDLFDLQREERGLHIEAYLAPPARSRSSPAGQYVLLNGRFIRDRFVQHAIREAYRGLLEQNRYPVVFIFLTLDPALVDVNVHPTKIEVRWQDSNLVHSQVLAALRDKLLTTDLAPALLPVRGPRPRPEEDPERAHAIRTQAADYLKNLAPTSGVLRETQFPAAPGGRLGAEGFGREHTGVDDPRGQVQTGEVNRPEVWDALYARPATASSEDPARPRLATGGGEDEARRALQVHNAYLVVETDDGIIIIDQHALHERVMYEKLRSQFTAGPLEAQRLLLPETVPVVADQMALVLEHTGLMAQLGIEVAPFGEDSIAIHTFPALLKNVDVVAFFRDLLDQLAEHGEQTHTEAIIHRCLDMMACKAAVKAGDHLTPAEVDALLAQRHLVDRSSNCPHGRPTTLRFSLADLEKQFKRR